MTSKVAKGLLVYSSVVSTAFLSLLLMGAKDKLSDFDEISTHRINITEPDGTLRMVISNKDQMPPVIIKGKERQRWANPDLRQA